MNLPELHRRYNTKAASLVPISRSKYGVAWSAYVKVSDLLLSLREQGSQEPCQVCEAQSSRIALTAGLLQSTAVVEETISAGYYSCACAIIRHNMEVLARTMHIREGKPFDDKHPPNIGILPFDMSKDYGRLSHICHVAKGEVLGDFIKTEDELVASPELRYNEDYSITLFATHIGLLLGLAWEIYLLHDEIYSNQLHVEILGPTNSITQILVDANLWMEKDQSDQK